MLLINALTKNARYALIVVLMTAFAVNAIASAPAGIERMRSELVKAENFPKWMPAGHQVALASAMEASFENRENSSENYGPLVGHFSSFYMANSKSFEGLCNLALSLEECKGLIWDKTQDLLAKKIALAAQDAVNELLFLKNNPYAESVKIPKEKVLASLGRIRGEVLEQFLEGKKTEFNIGGFKTSLFNRHPEYAEASKLLGKMSAKEMSALLLGGESKGLFAKKFKRAATIYEMEWKLFCANVLVPHTMFSSLQNAAESVLFLKGESARFKAASLGLGMCETAPAALTQSPELRSFCKFLHQNS